MRARSTNVHISGDAALEALMASARRQPLLSREEEMDLGRAVQERGDQKARERLTAAHVRLVMSMAAKMSGYGVEYAELVSQGMIGLMKAVDKFDPAQENRFSTYAMWWIRAEMTDHVLRNWSMVKVGTTAAQKTLFFKLKRAKARLGITHGGDLRADEAEAVATATGTTVQDVVGMNRRVGMGGDASLNIPYKDKDGGTGADWLEHLESTEPSPYDEAAERRRRHLHRTHIAAAMERLNDRERHIVTARHFEDEVSTLEELGAVYGVTRERIRQIEAKALAKIKQQLVRAQTTRDFDLLAA